jgi:hypothetical protein
MTTRCWVSPQNSNQAATDVDFQELGAGSGRYADARRSPPQFGAWHFLAGHLRHHFN